MATTPSPPSPQRENMDTSDTEKDSQDQQQEHVEGTMRLFDSSGHVRNIPVPSNDPADPLGWPLWKRSVVMLCLCVYGTAGFGVIQSPPLFFTELIAHYMKESRGQFQPSKIVQLASYPSLCMGLGNFLFVPLSMMWGRRAMLLFNNALLLASIIWAAKCDSFETHLVARCLQALACGISDCLLPIIVLDMTFLHLRGFWMSFYWAVTAAGSAALLVSLPFAVQDATPSWRMSYWFWAAFTAFAFVVTIFCFPETHYPRAPALIDGHFVITDSYGGVRITAAEDAPGMADTVAQGSGGPPPSESYLSQMRPYKYQQSGFRRFYMTYAEMAVSLISPSIFYVLMLNTILFAGLVALSLTYSRQLEHEPWHFSPEAVGTAQAGSFFGALIALGLTGATSDRISAVLTRRNGGIREPEHVLPNFIVPTLLGFGGLVLYGIIASNQEKYHWIGVHFSFGMYYCGFVALSAITGVWIGEATPHYSGAALVLVCGGRNALSFIINENFMKWIDSQGLQNAYIQLGSVLLGVMIGGGLPMFFFNKHIRRYLTSHMKFNLE